MQQEACDKVYIDRILRGMHDTDGFYSPKKLGAIGSDLAAVACFFEKPWTAVSPQLSEAAQAWLLNAAAFSLRALGRLTEALEPYQASLDMCVEQENWKQAAIRASNLSDLELTLGQVAEAVQDAERSVDYADRSGDAFQRMARRTMLADVLFQAGQKDEAADLFRQAEAIQAEYQSRYCLLYGVSGFRYCDLLLTPAERAAWQLLLNPKSETRNPKLLEACRAVQERATQTYAWAKQFGILLDIALNHLSLGWAALYQAILAKSETRNAKSVIEEALDSLRQAAHNEFIVCGLLSRALLRFVEDDTNECRADLDEAWQIAERGSMRLFMADVLLYRGRLFRDKAALAEVRELIEQCGYLRRDGELADAEEAAKSW